MKRGKLLVVGSCSSLYLMAATAAGSSGKTALGSALGGGAEGPAIGKQAGAAIELSLPEIEKMPAYLNPAIALIAGILILVRPQLLNYIIAIYLIVIGVLGLLRL
jgi:hypothetical protein